MLDDVKAVAEHTEHYYGANMFNFAPFQRIICSLNELEAYKIAIRRCIELCDRQGINSKQRIKSILMELIKEPHNEQNPPIK